MSDAAVPAAVSGTVFISHSSRDRQMAHTISAALEHRGVRCWISSRDIGPGENFQEAIVKAIRHSRVMVLVFTGHANNSNEIKKEMALASQNNLSVIPVKVEDVVPNDAFAYEFATRQWIDAFSNWDHAIERLALQIAQAPALGATGPAPPPPATTAARPAPKSNATGLYVAAGLVVLVAGAGGAYVAFRPAPGSAPQAATPAPASASPAAIPSSTGVPAQSRTTPILADARLAMRNQNYAEALRLFQQGADQRLPAANFFLGIMYQQGLGTSSDYAKAMDYYHKAADNGFAAGYGGIGQLYQHGFGVPQDFAEARRNFQLAADKDAAIGFVGLGNLYASGEGVPRDYAQAMQYYIEGDKRNGTAAAYFIGLMYERGEGVPADLNQAKSWMKKAADAGNTDAQAWLKQH
jgi:hypothetical protein